MTGTMIYGQSDDNVYADGEFNGQVSKYGTDDEERGILFYVSDGTIFEIQYGKLGLGIWGIKLIKQGTLFERLELCTDEDADIYSDIIYFNSGIKWVIASTEWEYMR